MYEPQTVQDWQDYIDQICEDKGWNEGERSPAEWAALLHTEASEFYEEYRNGHLPDEIYLSEGGKPEGQAVELADAAIRIFHWFARHNISLQETLKLKTDYNLTRPYRHGGKLS